MDKNWAPEIPKYTSKAQGKTLSFFGEVVLAAWSSFLGLDVLQKPWNNVAEDNIDDLFSIEH